MVARGRARPLRRGVHVLPPREGRLRDRAIGPRAGIASLAILAGLSLAVAAGAFVAFDRQALDLTQRLASHPLGVVASMLIVFGQAEVTAGIAAGLTVARLRARRRDFWAPRAIALVVVLESPTKIVVAQPLPPADRSRELHFFSGRSVPFAHAFPSGHAARDAFLLLIARGVPVALVVLAVVAVAVSRVYLAQHWLSDVVGGLLLGAGLAWIAVAAVGRK